MGARASESCLCADEGHQQGLQKRLTAAGGLASLGSLAWKTRVLCQMSLLGTWEAVRIWAQGSWLLKTFDTEHWKDVAGIQQLLAMAYDQLEGGFHHN